ncbi:MAG TPA: sigma-70 family RNA polymerase sigma factor, partial [Candidatus Saccharimonadales bacterium]|nr:sigma-70 family RNA polymerase sigma factor [Candidatus Saccharimonadales bacterium]
MSPHELHTPHGGAEPGHTPGMPIAAAVGQIATAHEAPPDLRILLPEAQAGDETAIRTLYALNQAIIAKKLGRYADPNIDVDEVRGAVIEKMLGANFDPHWPLPEGTDPEEGPSVIINRYGKFIAKTIRSVITDSMRHRTAEQPASHTLATTDREKALEPGTTSKYKNGDGTAAIPAELINTILTEPQQVVFYLRRNGMTNAEISKQLKMSEGALKSLIHRAIARLEEHILTPAGLVRIEQAVQGTGFKAQKVRVAIREGDVQAVKILSLWYTKPEWVQRLQLPPNTLRLSGLADVRTITSFKRK